MKLIIALFSLFFVISAHAKTWEFSSPNAVSFTAIGKPGFLRIGGEGAKLEGKVDGDLSRFSAEFKVDLTTLTTRFRLRDRHMHEKYLETAKFATATLVISKGGPIELAKSFSWDGLLTLKGKTNPVSGKASFDGKQLKAEFIIRLDEYSVGVPSYAGVSVASDVVVNVSAVAE